MSVTIQIRNVPEDLHRRLKVRAATVGMSLSDYLLSQIRSVAERPTAREIQERLARMTTIRPKVPPAELIRRERKSR